MVQDLLQKEKLSRHMSLSHEEEKTQNKYKLVLCVDNYNGGERGRERTKILYVYTQRKKKNTRWVTVLPIWTGMCLLLEVKGQRATLNSAVFQGKKQHFWKSKSFAASTQ